MRRVIGLISRLWNQQDGVSAIEFALVAPIILLLLAGAVDFGSTIHTKMQIENATQSALTYAMGRGQPLDAAKTARLAGDLGQILTSRLGNDLNLTIDVNHGARRIQTGAAGADSGNAALGGLCYCPTLGQADVAWNGAVACGRPCPDGGYSGKFVYLQISKPHVPLFAGYGLAEDGFLRLHTLGRIE